MNIKALFAPSDMTVGSPAKKIVAFTIPMVLGNIAQQLYNTVDSIVVGKYVGDNALAAVGSASPIFNLLLVLFVGISTGAGIMVSQYYGAKEREDLNKTIGNCITLSAIASLIIMGLAVVCVDPILELLGTPASIMHWCHDYLMILLLGIAGLCYYNMFGGILRGLGDSTSSLVYLLIATVINIVLDIFFVAVLKMEVAGVAYATVIAQTISAALCYRKLMKMKDVYDADKKYFKLSKSHSTRILKLGLPSGLTQAIFSLAMILVQSLTNSYGEMVIAANVIIMRVDGFAMMPNFSFGTALTTYAGQNVGARQLDRVEEGAKVGTFIAMAVSATITVIILLFGHQLMGMFTETEALIQLSMKMMRILAVGYVAMAVTQSLSGIMRGAGDTLSPMWISIFTTVVVRVPLAYAIAYLTATPELPNGTYYSIFISLLTSWLLGAILTFIVYKRKKWRQNLEQKND